MSAPRTYVPVGGSMAELLGDGCGIPLWVRQEDYDATLATALGVIRGLRRGGQCFCQHGIGDPLVPRCTAACQAATRFLENAGGASNALPAAGVGTHAPLAPSPDLMDTDPCPEAIPFISGGHLWSNTLRDGTVECLWCRKHKPV